MSSIYQLVGWTVDKKSIHRNNEDYPTKTRAVDDITATITKNIFSWMGVRPARMDKYYIHINLWYVITYLWPNFNGIAVEVSSWRSNYIPLKTMGFNYSSMPWSQINYAIKRGMDE